MAARWLGGLLLLLVSLLASFPTASAQSWTLLSFCYVSYNTLPTSPFLLWSVATQGTLNVSSLNSTTGLVTDARATRVASFTSASLGNTSATSNLTGVSAPSSYLGNSNLLSVINASAPLLPASVLVLTAAAAVPFPGTASTPSALALAAGGELDGPPNDGETSVVTTLWQTAAATYGLSASYPGCTLAVPSSIVNTPASVALYTSAGPSYQFCADISGGPGEGTSDGGAWNVDYLGTVQSSGWVGTTVSGRSASVITVINGTRTFVYENGTTQVAALSLATFTASLSAVASSPPSAGYLANNVIYPGWPQLDSYGWALALSSSPTIQGLANTQTTITRLSISAAGELGETILASNGTAYLSTTGTFLSQAVNGSGNASSLAALSQQCSIDYGAIAQYAFCYFVDNSALPTSSPQRGIVFAYGIFTAAGPQPQRGRQALRIVKITGVRYIQAMQNGSSALITQNLKHIKYLNQDGSLGQQTDDLVFTSAPALDQQGLLLETNGNAIFFSGTSGNTDIRLSLGPYGVSEVDSDGVSATLATNGTDSGFFYQPLASGSVTTQCSAYSSTFTSSSVPAPAINAYSFCYGQSTSQYNLTMVATLQLYSTPISFLGRTVYAIAGMSGTRYFQSASGASSANAIVGPSSDWFAKQINPGESYDQLFSLSNSSQVVDVQGILYQVNGSILTPSGSNYQLQVVRLYFNATSAQYTEEVEVGVVAGVWQYSEVPVTRAVIVQDGGASAANGSVASAACGMALPVVAPPPLSSSSTSAAVVAPSSSTSASPAASSASAGLGSSSTPVVAPVSSTGGARLSSSAVVPSVSSTAGVLAVSSSAGVSPVSSSAGGVLPSSSAAALLPSSTAAVTAVSSSASAAIPSSSTVAPLASSTAAAVVTAASSTAVPPVSPLSSSSSPPPRLQPAWQWCCCSPRRSCAAVVSRPPGRPLVAPRVVREASVSDSGAAERAWLSRRGEGELEGDAAGQGQKEAPSSRFLDGGSSGAVHSVARASALRRSLRPCYWAAALTLVWGSAYTRWPQSVEAQRNSASSAALGRSVSRPSPRTCSRRHALGDRWHCANRMPSGGGGIFFAAGR